MEERNSLQTSFFAASRQRLALAFVLFSALAFPLSGRADVGTPLMWAGILHLFIGNALIGLLEGYLISRLFRIPKMRTFSIMIPANYFSAWIGSFFIDWIRNVISPDLNSFWRYFWLIALSTYFLTLILEWPFVALCFLKSSAWLIKSVKASFVVQSASYILLFAWYGYAGSPWISHNNIKIVPASEFSLPKEMSVYYISSRDGSVYRKSLKRGTETKIAELHSPNEWNRLCIEPNPDDTNQWDLFVETSPRDRSIVAQRIPIKAAPVSRNDSPFDEAASFGNLTNSHWIVATRQWEGSLGCYDVRSRPYCREYIYFETVFCYWPARHPVYVSSDLVLFQLGPDQICIFSPDQYKIALLWHGRGAVPVIDRE